MPKDELTDAEVHEMTKAGRRMWPSTDPIHDAPPEPKDPDDLTPQDYLDKINWEHRS